MMLRMQRVESCHTEEYGDEPEAIAVVPGRFHLLGEYLWFAQGNTLSMAIDQTLTLCVSRRKDSTFRLFSLTLGERRKISTANLRYRKEDRWANSVKAVILSFMDGGYHLTGLNCTILSQIPPDAGLGTPNALKVAMALVLGRLFAATLPKESVVSIVEHANERYLKTHAHRADILCVLFAKQGSCVRTDHRKKQAELCQFPSEGKRIVLTDSRVPRFIAREEFTARLKRCVDAYELVKRNPDMPRAMSKLMAAALEEIDVPEGIRRRVISLVRESLGVDEAIEVLRKRDFAAFSRVVNRSHERLRDRFEISCPELDWLVKRALEFVDPDAPDVVCSRLTGRGFGGCTYAILRDQDFEPYLERLDEYERIFGFKAAAYEVQCSEGARVL